MNFKFCPNCGTKGSVEQQNLTDYECTNCKWHYWNNPRACTAIAFIKDDKVLVAKRGIEPNKGKYDLPGGFLEFDEEPQKGAQREIKEEMGITVNKLKFVAAYPHVYLPGVSSLDLIYIAENWDNNFVAKDDVAKLEWQPFSFIESDQFVPPYPGLPAILEKYAKMNR